MAAGRLTAIFRAPSRHLPPLPDCSGATFGDCAARNKRPRATQCYVAPSQSRAGPAFSPLPGADQDLSAFWFFLWRSPFRMLTHHGSVSSASRSSLRPPRRNRRLLLRRHFPQRPRRKASTSILWIAPRTVSWPPGGCSTMRTPCFASVQNLPRAGVLVAIPALPASGLLSTAEKIYGSFGSAFYGLRTTLRAYVLWPC